MNENLAVLPATTHEPKRPVKFNSKTPLSAAHETFSFLKQKQEQCGLNIQLHSLFATSLSRKKILFAVVLMLGIQLLFTRHRFANKK